MDSNWLHNMGRTWDTADWWNCNEHPLVESKRLGGTKKHACECIGVTAAQTMTFGRSGDTVLIE